MTANQSSALIANGQITDLSKIKPLLAAYTRIIAVDAGLQHCKDLGMTPDLIIGDFDSASPALLQEYHDVPKIVLLPDKIQTDLEVALEHELAQGSSRITLFGAWGHRVDHSMTNLLIASRYPGIVQLETDSELVYAIQGHAHISAHIGQTLSLIPINGPAKGITTRGLKWELKNQTLDSSFVGISNICLQSEISISIKEGTLICCLLKF